MQKGGSQNILKNLVVGVVGVGAGVGFFQSRLRHMNKTLSAHHVWNPCLLNYENYVKRCYVKTYVIWIIKTVYSALFLKCNGQADAKWFNKS